MEILANSLVHGMLTIDRTLFGAMLGAIIGIVLGSFFLPQIHPSIEAVVCGLIGALAFRYLWRY